MRLVAAPLTTLTLLKLEQVEPPIWSAWLRLATPEAAPPTSRQHTRRQVEPLAVRVSTLLLVLDHVQAESRGQRLPCRFRGFVLVLAIQALAA